jgi:hypothetical protein
VHVTPHLRARVLAVIVPLAASVIVGPAVGDDANGIAVCTESGGQYGPVIVSDGAGGCIVAWHDLRPTVPANGVIFAQRVSATGIPQWATNGVALSTTGDLGGTGGPAPPAIDSDAAGGAFVAYGGNSSQPRAQRVNAAGAPQWGADGVQLTNASSTMRDPAIVRDINGAGGAIVVWRQDNGAGGLPDIYAQKVNAAGAIQWGPTGVAVTMSSMNSETLPALVSDGAGGAFITYFNGTSGCRIQRLNSSGVSQWPTTSLSGISNNRRPAIVADGSGGAIVAWASGNNGIFTQRVSSLGDKLWSPGAGVQLCTAGNQCAMIPDGAGGATVTWQDFVTASNYNIYAQRVNGSGATQWITNGVEVCFVQDDQLAPTIVTDGGTGAIITWYDGRMFSSGDDIYAQRIDVNGASQWTPNGLPLCTATGDQQLPTIAIDGAGGAFVAWQDGRSGTNDIYLQHLDGSGQALSVPGENQAPWSARTWPNPFLDRVQLAFVLPAAATVRLEVFDVRGRSIRAYAPGLLAAGDHVLAWDGRSSDGHPAGQGIYFLRAIGPGIALSRMVARLE